MKNNIDTNAATVNATENTNATVYNTVFTDCPEYREALSYSFYALTAARAKMNFDSAVKSISTADKKLAEVVNGRRRAAIERVRAAAIERRDMAKLEAEAAADMMRQSADTYSEYLKKITTTGNNRETAAFLIAVLSTCFDKSLRGQLTRGLLGTTEQSAAAALYFAFRPIVEPENGFTAAGHDRASTAERKTARETVENILKNTFSLPYETAYSNKFRTKLNNTEFHDMLNRYTADIRENMTESENGDITLTGGYEKRYAITARTRKDGTVTYNGDKFANTIIRFLAAKLGVSEN